MGVVKTYIGALVRLNRDITTTGGTKFKAGLRMRCVGSTSGGLELRCYKRGWREYVVGIPKWWVTVIEWPKDKEED